MASKRHKVLPRARDALSSYLARLIVGAQRRWAAWMQRRTRHWKVRQQANFLYAVLLVFGGTSTYLLVATFSTDRWQQQRLEKTLRTAPMPTPLHTLPQPPAPMQQDTLLFRQFRYYIDSLRHSSARGRLDSFLQARPGFMDSVYQAEHMIRQFHH
ncbi:hypothetical protein [Chitinophaga filiformis]|uniref:Uncharacterized protein n=1 Tax=Chitinophaga filiformis TaxID=104663 RepID=A0ABY4HYD5_CHIFI|nr:hypothetical protein [Chitinophaga filiformis]UPK68024.1 hypothetical protein MYF79_24020 [Chitinophaga filiformis]